MEFLNNKYTKMYFSIVENAKLRKCIDGYSEKHHIIPKSLGGDNSHTNIVILNAREHFVCHRLLPKMTTGSFRYKMLSAIFRMMHSSQSQRYIGTSHTYNSIKIEKAKLASTIFSGDNNPFYGKTHSEETRQRLKIARELQVARQGTTMTAEARQKLSVAAKGRILTDEHKRKIGIANSNKPMSEEHKARLLLTRKGIPLTPDHRKLLSDVKKNIPQLVVKCPHCDKSGGVSLMKRWHFDNCKCITNGKVTNAIS